MASFISPRYRKHYLLTLVAVFLAFAVIVLGGYTRLTDAGLSCPDWPHCFGFLAAPHTDAQLQKAAEYFPTTTINIKKAWTEMTHRYFAGAEGILILILAGCTLYSRQFGLKGTIISFLLAGLLIIQVLLGMLTVTEQLKPIIVLSHLLTGLSILCLLWWTYLDLFFKPELYPRTRGDQAMHNDKTYLWLWLGLALVIAQISLGGWVSTHYAGLACIDFPYCNGTLLPPIHWHLLHSDLISIHMLHRIGAFITTLYFAFLIFILFRNPIFKRTSIIITFLLLTQLFLGIANLVWLRPIHIALTHQAIAILLLLSVITALVKAHVAPGTHNE